jgi:hypothetical protein
MESSVAIKKSPTMTPDISTTLGGIPLTSVVYNASGPRTGSSAAMSKIAASESGVSF